MIRLKKLIIIIVILIILIIISIILLNKNNNSETSIENQNNFIEKTDIELLEVKNPHMYFTVKSCVEKYMNYIQQGDAESVYKIVDAKYIKEHNITVKNIMQHVEKIDNPISISIDEMKYIDIDENNQEYFISGAIIEDTVGESVGKVKEKICITVKIDKENMIYSIIPYGYGGPIYEEK